MVSKLKKSAPKSEDSGASKKICKKCQPIILGYADENSDVSYDLKAISSLCRGITNTEFIDENTLIQVGVMLDRLLEKQNILKYFFFGEPLDESIDHSVIAGELHRLKIKRGTE